MFRTLLTTTALAALLTAGAMAQDAAAPAADAPATEAPATPDAPAADAPAADAPAADAPAATTTEAAPAAAPTSILATGYTVTDLDNLATEIIGKQVYSSSAADAEHIGDVNNLVIGEGGQVAAVIIGVGGFLGIGEKNVAVNFAELELVTAEDGTERYVLPTTKEALEAAPAFETTDEDAAAPATDGATTPAPADQPADAMAPAEPAPAEPAPAAPAN